MNLSLCYDDVLIVPQYSGVLTRNDCSTQARIGTSLFKIPIIAANMDTICGIKMAHKMYELGGIGIIHRNESIQKIRSQIDTIPYSKLFIAVGSVASDRERIDKCLEEGFSICVDIAHGHSYHMKETLAYIKERANIQNIRPKIIAGNVCTVEATRDLHSWGANVVKVGVGGGSVCTTRIKTGSGVPQFSAVMNCAKTRNMIPIIADGGIRNSGDAAKALAAGATFVMIGGMLAGTDCTPDWNKEDALLGKDMEFRGMASLRAKEATGLALRNEEGISTKIKARFEGSTEEVIQELIDGIKSAMSYSGCFTLDAFRKEAIFTRVTSNTYKENHAHFRQ